MNAKLSAFNGAAGVNPRIGAHLGTKGPFRWTFNGAAGVNPRIVDASGAGTKTAFPLQWGRGCEPADSWRARRKPTRASSFNGAAGVNPRIADYRAPSDFCS